MTAPRLIALTGLGSEGDRERSRAAGFVAHLTKRTDPALLERLLEEIELSPAGSSG